MLVSLEAGTWAAWASAVATAAATIAAVWIAVHGNRVEARLRHADDARRESDDRRRALANAALLTLRPSGGSGHQGGDYTFGYEIRNNSSYIFTDIVITARFQTGDVWGPNQVAELLQGNGEAMRVGVTQQKWIRDSPRPSVAMEYTDFEGQRWLRDQGGRLSPIRS